MLRSLTLVLALAASAAAASTPVDQATQDKIRATLTAQGYEVRKIDLEDGMIEVYALKGGARFELYLDSALNIVRTKAED